MASCQPPPPGYIINHPLSNSLGWGSRAFNGGGGGSIQPPKTGVLGQRLN